MKPFRGVFSARPYAAESNGNHRLGPELAPADGLALGLTAPRPGPKHLLWEVLVELGFVDEQRVLEAEAVARASRQDLGAVLLERGLVTSEQLARAVAQREGVLFADLEAYAVDEAAASLITPAVAERYGAIPIGFGSSGDVLLALANPRDRHAVNDISMMVEPSVTRVVATRESIDALIQARKREAYRDEDGAEAAAAEGGAPAAAHLRDANGAADPAATWFAPEDSTEDAADFDELKPDAAGEEEGGAEPAFEPDAPEAGAGEGSPAGEDGSAERDPVPASGPGLDVVGDALDPAPDAAGDSLEARPEPEQGGDRELLESLSRGVGELERLLREGAAGDRETVAESEHRLAETRAELDRERAERAEAEQRLREQLEAERASREETERRLREELERVRAQRTESERALREQLKAERAESERGLREEIETEQATREALAAELAAVRTARDDLARRVASARDLLELGARPFVPLHGREG